MEKVIKILAVVPGSKNPASMIFAKDQVASINNQTVVSKIFFLNSRLSLSALFKSWMSFRREVKAFKPDIVHPYYGTVTAFFCAVSTLKPLVISFQGSDLNKTPSDGFARDFFGRLLSNLSILRAYRIICVSPGLKNNVWWQKEKAEIIPNGINVNLFVPMPADKARKHLGWSDLSEKVILFNANNPKIKRLDLAEKVINQIKKQIPNARLEVLKGGTSPREIAYYLNACDCLLLCSNSEGSPMIIKEALACNTPIASNDIGDVKERINSVKGTIITNKTPSELAGAIIKIIGLNERTNGREKLLKDGLSEEDVARRVTEIYKRKVIR
jgi:teichuronic acid biosynthesis glycosyltransferase TuaC